MTNLSKTISDLRRQREHMVGQLEKVDRAIAVLGNLGNTAGRRRSYRTKNRLSPQARRRIARAQKLRWAKWRTKRRKQSA